MEYDKYKQSVQLLETTINEPHLEYMKSDGQDWPFFLERTQKLFDRIGNPEKQFKYIHVAGTAGKGSTAMMVYEIMRQAGHSVGLYLSPHVTTSIERVHANGQLISADDFSEGISAMLPLIAQIQTEEPGLMPSYSELFMAIAMNYFKTSGVEWVVLETGCGGRYDKTNIIPPPEVALLTNISLEHCNILGDSLEKIAFHKAGIIKPGSAIYSTETDGSVQSVFNEEAAQHNLNIEYLQPTTSYETAMLGEHQQENAALAAAAAQHLGITEEKIQAGIRQAKLPARIEVMQAKPRVILDGAHSPSKIEALVHSLEQLRPWKKLHLVFTAKQDKNLEGLLKPIIPLADTAIVTTFSLPGFGSYSSTDIKKVMQRLKTDLPKELINHILNEL
ncbi:bifunctional folylpolyglutamate synthase/dihydrofolate synthase [Patescibacteria group bacterium]